VCCPYFQNQIKDLRFNVYLCAEGLENSLPGFDFEVGLCGLAMCFQAKG
jgi:hypothetical protein